MKRKRKQLSRTFVRVDSYLPGLTDGEHDVDVTRLDGRVPVKFVSAYDPPTEPFYLARGTWHALKDPDEIIVSVSAA